MLEQCPICGSEAKIETRHDKLIVDCVRCRGFDTYTDFYQNLSEEIRMALSHWIGKQNEKGNHPDLFEDYPEEKKLLELKLPNPAEQADNLIVYLGNIIESHSSKTKINFENVLKISAIVGCVNIGDLNYIIGHLEESKLLLKKQIPQIGHEYLKYINKINVQVGQTFSGWQKYEDLRKDYSESKQIFMAMEFFDDQNEPTEVLFNKFLKKAVKETGLELVDIRQKAKAGVIDNNMRLEIRKSCLLLSELTHNNNGAYWEAGFAEGMNIPVIYLCEKEKFDEYKTHFDTNHCTTIIWEKGKEVEAMKKLKATIRLSVPDKVKMKDEE